MKQTMSVILVVIGIVVMIASIWAYRYYTAETRGIIGQEERVQSALHRMGAYNHFYDLCAAIQGHEATLAASRSQLEDTSDENERQRIRANIAGITSQRARSIAQYNADARKEHTVGQFRDAELPYEISVEGENTEC